MDFTLSLQRSDPSSIRATTRLKADDPAAVDLWTRTEAEASDRRVPRGSSIARAPRMLSLSPATRIFVALEPVDLRQSFNGLSARVQSVLIQDPLSGHLFLFTNRSHNRIKVLLFDGSGLWVCAKRLEKGTFGWPQGEGPSSCLRPEELTLLLNGLEGTPRRNWFRR